ncbi:MAG: glycosyltransferase family 117 protein [Bacteroidota bacterium]
MERFKKVNTITGWAIFLIAATVYLIGIEPTVSFWDCGEYIASAFKLQVGHPPGAPFFMLIGRLFTVFAPKTSDAATMVNSMSALASAFTILFLFWSITHLAKKMFSVENDKGNLLAVIGAGVIGALAFTFSDTFWFSAEEGEVYALSSLFTAFVFYAILKWENIADEAHSNRWLILIAFLMGISIGVHLLNLLAIPAIVFVYYFRKYKITNKGIIGAALVSVILLGTFNFIIIPGIVRLASGFELFFINALGLPFNTGNIIFVLVIAALLAWGLHYTHKLKKVTLNTLLLGLTVVIIGYSSYTMLMIRSAADPPMDENDPETVFSLYHYLKREQYGQHPLVTGPYYNAPIVDSEEPYTYDREGDEYVKSYSLNPDYEYDEQFTTFFPRMYSRQSNHVEEYKKWADIEGRQVTVTNRRGEEETRTVPTFGENLKFFFKYQVGHMYLRYFMWNFAGRQNDIQGHGGPLNGNWLSGIKPLDEARIGNQDNLPEKYSNNKARNTYYMLPLILGLIGFFFHYKKHPKDFTVVLLLFLFTGLAIVVYLNQTPLQPRERDYAYAGSFYAFSIWIGFGVLGIYNFFKNKAPKVFSAIAAILLTLVLVPANMAKENWDDHDRSNRYIAHDFAYNYLNSCAPNAILFTHGDNDTFPLWYAQEVEGIRTDVRVVNLSLLNTDWYIDQMKRKAYDSEPVPFSMERSQYKQGTRDQVPMLNKVDGFVDVKQVVDFVASDNEQTQLSSYGDQKVNYIPTKKFNLNVDSAKVVNEGIVKPENADKIVDEIKWQVNRDNLMKNDLMMLDLLANFNWERPVYFVSPSDETNLGLSDYLQLEGFAYRLVPIETEAKDRVDVGRVDSEIMYENLMEDFKYGNMQDPDVYMDYTSRRTSNVIRIRNKFARLARKLIDEDKKQKAVETLDRAMELTPHNQLPYGMWTLEILNEYYRADATEKANALAEEFAEYTKSELDYYFNLNQPFADAISREQRMGLHIMQRLSQITGEYGQEELSEEYENYLNNKTSSMQGRGQFR